MSLSGHNLQVGGGVLTAADWNQVEFYARVYESETKKDPALLTLLTPNFQLLTLRQVLGVREVRGLFGFTTIIRARLML